MNEMEIQIEIAREKGLQAALAYDRISDDQQAGGGSLGYQEAAATRYAAERGLHIVRFYTVIESARKEGRRAFNQMLDDAQTYGVRHLLYKSTDRMSRNYSDMLKVERLVDDGFFVHLYQSGRVISKDSNHDDKFILAIETAVARHLSDKISHDVRAHQRYKASRGIAPYPKVFGYTFDKACKKFVIDKDVEASLRYLFDTFDSNRYSLIDFSAILNAGGYKTPRGLPWTKQTLHRLLTSNFYHGCFYYDGVELQGTHEPYYSKERYEERLACLDGRFIGARTRPFNFLFEKFLKCRCGFFYTGEMKKQKYIYYKPHACTCEPRNTAYYKEPEIFGVLDEAIAAVEFSASFAETVKQMFRASVNDKNHNMHSEGQRIARQIAEIERKSSRVLELYADSDIEKSVLRRKLDEYQRDLAALQNRQKTNLVDHEKVVFKIAEVIDLLREMPAIYRQAPPEGKAEILRSMADGVILGDTVEIRWKKPYSFLMNDAVLISIGMHAEEDAIRNVLLNFQTWLAA
jgi:DNA invertase Pin-like site-specific DNA recombinase